MCCIQEEPDLLPPGDAYVVVYSVIDHESFDDAVDLLHELRKRELLQQTAVILVANKGDVVRLREVAEEGQSYLTTTHACITNSLL